MTIRTFFTIFIKMLGLYLLFDSIGTIVQLFAAIMAPKPFDPEMSGYSLLPIYLFATGVYALFFGLFIFKTNWLIDKLHLDKGFTTDTIEWNIEYTTVLSIAIIVIGGLMFVQGLPAFCNQAFSYFQANVLFKESSQSHWLILYFVQMVVAYLLMTNSKSIASFISKQS